MTSSLIKESYEGKILCYLEDDVDTDQIIPARFLKEITFDRMGEYLFYDLRFGKDGEALPHVLNQADARTIPILLVGKNFGCGSSREHAPQALARFGFSLIIGESFAEIFAGNCKAIGVPLLTLSHEAIVRISADFLKDASCHLKADLKSKKLSFHDQWYEFDMIESHRQAFLAGTWDAASLLHERASQVAKLEARLPYKVFD